MHRYAKSLNISSYYSFNLKVEVGSFNLNLNRKPGGHMMFERILVALDNSTDNRSVFETALSLAKWADARLMLAHVLPCEEMDITELHQLTDHHTFPSHYPNPALSPDTQQVCETQGLRMLREFHAIATTAGVGSDLAQPLANPGHQICDLAIGWGADLIVIGRRGLTEADEAIQGSVSQYVTHHAPCPVLIVQHQLFGQVSTLTRPAQRQVSLVQ